MMYPFMTLNDGSEIVHSETRPDGRVKVYIEKPDEKDCFHHVTCYLPDYTWEDSFGFTDEELARYKEIVSSTSNLILEFAADGGFENASGFFLGVSPCIADTPVVEGDEVREFSELRAGEIASVACEDTAAVGSQPELCNVLRRSANGSVDVDRLAGFVHPKEQNLAPKA